MVKFNGMSKWAQGAPSGTLTRAHARGSTASRTC